MNLTDIRIKLCDDQSNRLKAFCALTFDCTFVIRDVKLIDGNEGLFLAMPSRKLADHCGRCGDKNHLRARYCNISPTHTETPAPHRTIALAAAHPCHAPGSPRVP